ncbi:MAG: response regulator [Phycisphaerales bacterium]
MLVVKGLTLASAEDLGALRDRFDVRIVDAAQALEAVKSGVGGGGLGGAMIAETGDFLALERELVERQSTALLHALGEGVCLADSEGRRVWANGRFDAYDQVTRNRIAQVCRQAAKGMSEQMVVAATAAAGGGGGGAGVGWPEPRRYDVAGDDGRFYEVLISAVPEAVVEGAAPAVRHVAAVVWDVSIARRQQQQREAIDKAGAELVKLDAEVVRRLHTGDRLRILEEKIIRFAHDLLHFDQFAIRLIDEPTGKLELVMSRGLPAAAMEVELYANRDGNGISGYVAATGRSYICPDTTIDPRYVLGIDQARSSLTVPLRLADKVIGIMNIESTRTGAFGEEDRQFAEAFANHVALALHLLNLLVVERAAVGEAVGGTVEGELAEPLDDISAAVALLKQAGITDPGALRHIERVIADVESIRRRMKDVAGGHRNILGAEKALSDAALDPLLAGKRVLVADDEPRIRQVIRDVLRKRGADVVICENGAEAIAVLAGVIVPHGGGGAGGGGGGGSRSGPGSERSVGSGGGGGGGGAADASNRPFDLLISDIKLPDKTGYEIFAAARKQNDRLPVILMTGFGYDPHHSIVRASQEGLSCVLFKPFQAERLIEEVHKALAAK